MEVLLVSRSDLGFTMPSILDRATLFGCGHSANFLRRYLDKI